LEEEVGEMQRQRKEMDLIQQRLAEQKIKDQIE
jgi:hypothetical protein